MSIQEIPNEKIDIIINLYSSGNFYEALDEIQKLNKNYTKSPLLMNISGACFAALGKIKEAVTSYEMAISIKPDFIDALFNLGNLNRELNNLDDAIKCYKKIINIMPAHGPAQINLGISLQESGLTNDAIDHYETAKLISPNNTEIITNLGVIYQNSGQYENAIIEYENALSLSPNDEILNNNLGASLRELGFFDEAKVYFKKSIKINKYYSDAHYNLGFLYQDLGYIEKSLSHFEKAISINNHPMSYHSLSYLKFLKSNDPLIEQMHSLATQNELNQTDKIHIYRALANVYEKLDNQTNFFKFLNKANSLHQKKLNYSTDDTKNEFNSIKEIFLKYTNESISDNQSISKFIKQPIFIVGMPRSGTSLVEQILASHHKVYGAGEVNTLTRLISPILINYINKDIDGINNDAISFIRNEYLEKMIYHETDKNFITDKLPLNFKYIGFILLAFPEAKIIHVNRDARATCWSNYRYYFESKNNGYSNNFDDLAKFYGLYKDLMKFWNELYPNKIFELNYEELTSNQESVTRSLLNYCDLNWDENCLKFYENNRAVKTISTLQVRKKIYQGSSEAWKKYKSYLKPLINDLKNY